MISIAHVFKTFALLFLATMVAAVPQTIEGKVAALDFKVDMLLKGMAKHVKADNVKAKWGAQRDDLMHGLRLRYLGGLEMDPDRLLECAADPTLLFC